MALQSFSIRRSLDVEIQVSRRGAFVAENFLLTVPHRLYRQGPGDQDDEDARESDGCVRYVTGTQSGWPVLPSERLDNRFSLRVHATKPRSFVADAPDGVLCFVQLRLSVYVLFRQPVPDIFCLRFGRRIVSIGADA